MKKGVYILLFVSILVGFTSNCVCQNSFYEKHFEIDSTNGFRKFKNNFSVKEIDSLKFYNELDRYEYPYLTAWGGLNLFYYCNQLVYFESQQNGEFQNVLRKFYLDSFLIKKIISTEITMHNKVIKPIEFMINSNGEILTDMDEFVIDFAYKIYSQGNASLKFFKKENLETKYLHLTDFYLKNAEIDSLILEIDKKIKDSSLIKYSLKNMHPCGGFVEGYFNGYGELQFINSYNSFPEGYIERQMYFYKNKVIYNSYRELNDEMKKDIFYFYNKSGDEKLNDNSNEKIEFPYIDFISSVNTCSIKMERDLILEYKTKD